MFTKKLFIILSMIFLVNGICGTAKAKAVAEKEAEENKIVLEYDFSEPIVSSGEDYDSVRMDGLETYERTGAPIVPVRPVRILVPFGKKVVDCKVIDLGTRQLSGTYSLVPAQKPYPLSYRGAVKPTEPELAIYGQEKPWPGKNREQLTTQSKRGYQIFTVNLFPLQYVPKTGKISYASKLRVVIELADAKTSGVLRPSKSVKTKLSATVDNPSALGTYPESGTLLKTLSQSLTLPPGGPYEYIIITNEDLNDSNQDPNFHTLRDAKIAKGITATIVTTEWIYANYDGTRPDGNSDNQTRIRNFLIDAYQSQNWGTQYVLLGGTNVIVPARLFWVDSLAGEVDYMPVDMYYGCVDPPDCNFDYDADGKYGEPTDGVGGGDVDLFAEIYVGRAPVGNATEVANFVRKTLAYDMTKEEYLPRIAMVGEWLGFGGHSEYATESKEQIRTGGFFDGYYTCGFEDNNYPIFIDFNTIGCIPNDPCCCWPLYDAPGYDWPQEKLICLMNGGIHCFNHLGHANYTYCMKLYTLDLYLLTNDDYFFAYSQGCMPGGFDKVNNCFAEVITSMEHGAFGAVMNARFGWGRYNSTDGPSQRFDRQFWDAPLGEGILEIGRANQDSKEDNFSSINSPCMRWCYYELNLFGDPQQKFKFSLDVNSKGYVNLNKSFYSCDANVGILVGDLDLAGSGDCDVNLTTSGGDLEAVTLFEVGPGVGIFTGSISTSSGDPCIGDKTLQVADGQIITGTYYDENDGTGNSAEPNDTAVADCNDPVISDLNFEEQFIGSWQVVTFQTNEYATARFVCGTSCGSSSIVFEEFIPKLSHTFRFKDTEPNTYYYFKIEVTDLLGNTATDSNDGNCYKFIRQDITVPIHYNTIQQAINAAQDYDVIVVLEGTYKESIDFKRKYITVQSTNPTDWGVVEATIINGNGAMNTVKCATAGSGLAPLLSGFTITGGTRGVYCGLGNSLNIGNCVITGNSNSGVMVYGTVCTITNCKILNNGDKGIYVSPGGIYVYNSFIYGNDKGVTFGQGGGGSIYNCTIANNSFGIKGENASGMGIRNSILWNDVNDISGFTVNYSVAYSCLKDCNDAINGTGNICSEGIDPCFVAPDSNNFHVKPASPCIDAGDPNGNYRGQTDIDDQNRIIFQVVDIGADESIFQGECFPRTYSSAYNSWKSLGKPNCWCGIYGTPKRPYQCDGDADGKTSGPSYYYRVYNADLTIMSKAWAKPITSPDFNACADFDHKDSGPSYYYRVYNADLTILTANWAKKDSQLPGDCPRP